eukprot:CAMPEP_0206370996 /NCGR_PEP_ID=MMETSP0294-20121207/6223_1 /ASSEMBLY_ACC=CAM_ASM_000327 /TAXON_ID=39354 /ORGANISM="Heterosigma akashiwo, Strain CCMP2393" /LENGTH=285 /DNA_ID=CAMNT_0053818045 /DNA_START=79 /DNA_END=931 /DNA_ORIENTATION=+
MQRLFSKGYKIYPWGRRQVAFWTQSLRYSTEQNADKDRLKRYLDNWRGGASTTDLSRHYSRRDVKQQTPTNSESEFNEASSRQPMISGKSYLIPTVHIRRGLTSEHLRDAIEAQRFFRSMPVVLDLSDASGKGSPHLQPVNHTAMSAFFEVLESFDLKPVGVTNVDSDLKGLVHSFGLKTILAGTQPISATPNENTNGTTLKWKKAAQDARAASPEGERPPLRAGRAAAAAAGPGADRPRRGPAAAAAAEPAPLPRARRLDPGGAAGVRGGARAGGAGQREQRRG